MKTKILSICLIATCFFSMTCFAQNTTYTINGKLENVSPMPKKMYMRELTPTGILQKKVDSATVVNGKYQFKGKLTVDVPIGVIITTAKGALYDMLVVMLDKGELNLVSVGTNVNFTASGSGATAQSQYEDMIGRDNMKERTELKKLMISKEYQANKELQADVQKRAAPLTGKITAHIYSYLKNNPNNRVSPYGTFLLIHESYFTSEPAKEDTLIQILPARVKANKLGELIINTHASLKSMRDVNARVAIGKKAQDFTQYNPDGKAITLSSFKGKYVLIDFWASWCGPCRAENPNVVKAYNRYKDKGFTILGVSLDKESAKAAWLKAIESDGLVWTQVSDLKGWANEAAKLYGVQAIPQNFLIDPSGVIVAKNLRGEELEKKLASLFN